MNLRMTRVVSVWGNLHSLSQIATSSSITHLERTKSLPTHLQHHVGAANICFHSLSQEKRGEKGDVHSKLPPKISLPTSVLSGF